MALETAPLATFWPIAPAACWWCWWRFELLYNDRRLICLSIFLTHVGNVFDQKETYDCAVRGALLGPAGAPAAIAAATAPGAPLPAAPEPPEVLASELEELAAWESIAAPLTIDEAAERALARFGRDPLEGGARKVAKGEEAAAETMLEAKFELDEPGAAPTGRVWT